MPDTRYLNRIILTLTLCGISVGLAAHFLQMPEIADAAWSVATVVALLPLTYLVARALIAGKIGVDIIALIAMAGSLYLGQYLAGAVIAVMLSGGQVLEEYAESRAKKELSALISRTPRTVNRIEGDSLTEAPIEGVKPGDFLMVKPGEIVPVDGVVIGGSAVLDESALTGESKPVEHRDRDKVLSGTVNASNTPFKMRAIASARESTYAGIVRLVEQAQASKAPLVRMADRYAIFFLPLTLAISALAWLISGDPVRALAVLVVATPCPLILAVPVAIVSGLSRGALRGIIIKGGGALETLARGKILVLDKTGTITKGTPMLSFLEPLGDFDPDELLRLAASLDQVSPHVLARPIVNAAVDRGLELSFPEEISEEFGSGITGTVGRRKVKLGRINWVLGEAAREPMVQRLHRRSLLDGSSCVFISVDGVPAGALILDDPVRPDAPLTIRALKRVGFQKIVMLTGDHKDVALSVGAAIGIDKVLAERSPQEKVDAVLTECTEGVTVMVGDGINDAAALAAADVGVAMGARGATASSEAADVVLLVDRLDRLIEAVRIARRSKSIAFESIAVGMGLSVLAMLVAAAGFLVPVAGALLQEVIDVVVILNALRALHDGAQKGHIDMDAARLGLRFRDEHEKLMPEVRRIRYITDRLDNMSPDAALQELKEIHTFLSEQLLPHEKAEDAVVYPLVADIIGGEDPTATMSRAHVEISHLIQVFGRLLEELPPEGPGPEDLRELRRVLYGLYAILTLHFAQEEESYLALIEERMRPESEQKGIGGGAAAK
jgi:heavy metal translocating P-type ATPase